MPEMPVYSGNDDDGRRLGLRIRYQMKNCDSSVTSSDHFYSKSTGLGNHDYYGKSWEVLIFRRARLIWKLPSKTFFSVKSEHRRRMPLIGRTTTASKFEQAQGNREM